MGVRLVEGEGVDRDEEDVLDETILVVSFLDDETTFLDINKEMIRYLRGAFSSRTAFDVLDVPAPPIPEQTPEDLLANREFWKYLHREYGAVSDSLLLFLTMCRHLDGDAQGDLATALRLALGEAMAISEERGTEVVLNTIVGDGEQLVAARVAHNAPSNTLYVRVDPEVGVSIASEPLDDDERWRAVDDSTLGIVRNGEWAPSPLDTPQPS